MSGGFSLDPPEFCAFYQRAMNDRQIQLIMSIEWLEVAAHVIARFQHSNSHLKTIVLAQYWDLLQR